MVTILNAMTEYDFWEEVYDTTQEQHEYVLGQSRVAVVEACIYDRSIVVRYYDNSFLAQCYIAVREYDDTNASVFHIVGADIKEVAVA